MEEKYKLGQSLWLIHLWSSNKRLAVNKGKVTGTRLCARDSQYVVYTVQMERIQIDIGGPDGARGYEVFEDLELARARKYQVELEKIDKAIERDRLALKAKEDERAEILGERDSLERGEEAA